MLSQESMRYQTYKLHFIFNLRCYQASENSPVALGVIPGQTFDLRVIGKSNHEFRWRSRHFADDLESHIGVLPAHLFKGLNQDVHALLGGHSATKKYRNR